MWIDKSKKYMRKLKITRCISILGNKYLASSLIVGLYEGGSGERQAAQKAAP